MKTNMNVIHATVRMCSLVSLILSLAIVWFTGCATMEEKSPVSEASFSNVDTAWVEFYDPGLNIWVLPSSRIPKEWCSGRLDHNWEGLMLYKVENGSERRLGCLTPQIAIWNSQAEQKAQLVGRNDGDGEYWNDRKKGLRYSMRRVGVKPGSHSFVAKMGTNIRNVSVDVIEGMVTPVRIDFIVRSMPTPTTVSFTLGLEAETPVSVDHWKENLPAIIVEREAIHSAIYRSHLQENLNKLQQRLKEKE